MAFRERLAWAILLATAVSYGGLLMLAGGSAFTLRGGDLVPTSALLVSLAVFAGLAFGLSGVLSLKRPREKAHPEDERERVIDLAGEKAGSNVLIIGIVFSLFVAPLHKDVTVLADALFATLIVSQFAKELRTIWAFRHGAA